MNEDLLSLSPPSDATRREFLVATLAAGFALAVQPVAAQTMITTDAAGLVAGEVKIPVRDGELPAYRATPAKGKNFPVALVVQEIFGVHEHIRDICRRFAKLGYVAVAPELFARQGDVSRLKDAGEIISKVVSKVPDAQVMSDLDASLDYAKKSAKGDAGRVGITGFCWGGRVVWLYAAHSNRLDAGVAWYGRLAPTEQSPRSPLQPEHPIDVAPRLRAPVLGLYGGKDRGIPLETVERMREELKRSKTKSEIVVYPDAPHGFHADYRESYRREAAEDGWRRLREWFKRHGAA